MGSVLGAYLTIDAVPATWYRPWNNTIVSYLHGFDDFQIDDIIRRFLAMKQRLDQADGPAAV